MNDWTQQLKVNRPIASTAAQSEPVSHDLKASPQLIQALEQAAARFAVRTDSFADGKRDTCLDIAAKLTRWGSFVSQKQKDFALKLIEWSKPRAAAAPKDETQKSDWGRPVPRLFAVMQKHATLHVDPLKLSRKNQDSLVWVMYDGQLVGKIEAERAVVWPRKSEAAGTTPLKVLAIIEEFEANPLETAKKYGKLSGRCCSCGRDLTDPASIEAGIGPICAQKFS